MTERMNPDVKAKWLAALRSGEYEQARGNLHIDTTGGEQFCCLGVLADLYRQERGGSWIEGEAADEFDDGKGGCANGSYLSDAIRSWAGADVDTFNSFPEYDSKTLPLLNDEERLDFPVIADLIEEYL